MASRKQRRSGTSLQMRSFSQAQYLPHDRGQRSMAVKPQITARRLNQFSDFFTMVEYWHYQQPKNLQV